MCVAFPSQSGDNFNVVPAVQIVAYYWDTVLAEFLVSADVLASATRVPDARVIIYSVKLNDLDLLYFHRAG